MKRLSVFVTCTLLAMLVVVPAYAQQPGTAKDPHHPGTPATGPAGPAPGPKSPDMPTMDNCRQMMAGDVMVMSMMSGPLPADPKDKAEMLHMRGEMMKAMGDIMTKHARRMQGTTAK